MKIGTLTLAAVVYAAWWIGREGGKKKAEQSDEYRHIEDKARNLVRTLEKQGLQV